MPARSALVMLLALGTLSAFAADPIDPMAWSAPAALPAITSTMTDTEVQARCAAALASVDLLALSASTRPAAGLELVAVAPGSQAQRLGLAVGDVLIAIDGHALRYQQDLAASRKQSDQTLAVWSATMGMKQVQVTRDRIGFSYINAWHPELGYLRAGPGRSPAWDREMVAAALSLRRDPALTLAALARAQHAGYAGIYLLPLRAMACAALGRFAEALAAGEAGFEKLPQAEFGELGFALYSLALLQCKLPQAAVALSRIPDFHHSGDGFPAYLAENQARLARHMVIADPMAAFGAAPPAAGRPAPEGAAGGPPAYDLLGMMRCIGYGNEDHTGRMQSIAFSADRLTVNPPPRGMFILEISIPQVATIDCTVGFSLKVKLGDLTDSDFCLFAGPPGLEGKRNEDGSIPGAVFNTAFSQDKSWSISVPGLPVAALRTSGPPAAVGSHTLRVALAEGVAAAAYDGQPAGVLPLRDGIGRLSLYLRVNGCEASITAFNLSTRDPQPPAGWKALAPVPGLKAPDKGAADF